MNEVAQFLNRVGGAKYNTGLVPTETNTVAPIVGLNSFSPNSAQGGNSAAAPQSGGSLFSGSSVGDPTAVNNSVSQGIGGVGSNKGSMFSWDGTSGTTGIGQGSTTDANQSYYANKALGDFATGMNYTPAGAIKAAMKNGLAYNMNNKDLLGVINDPNNGYSDPISALAAIQGWSGNGVQLSSPSMSANPMQQDPATAQQQALAAALTSSGNSVASYGNVSGGGNTSAFNGGNKE